MQNLFKSIFISIFPMFTLFGAMHSILYLYRFGFSYSYSGILIETLAIIVFFAGLFIKSQARTQRNLNINTIVISIGFLIAVVGGYLEKNTALSLLLSMLLLLAWIAYLTWYSTFKNRDASTLKLENILPNFELEDLNKNKIPSKSYLGNPTIYLFYRGNWCPLCMAQIKEIAAKYKALEERGANMVFVSPQPHKFSKDLAKKYDLGFHFLTDADNRVAKQLGIFSENGIPTGFQILGYDSDTVLPTVIITDAKGKIVFADFTDNYRVRPEPETFIKVLDGI